MNNTPFKLSDPGLTGPLDPSMLEYLRSYGLPLPPEVRYGFTRFPSEHTSQRVSLLGQAWVPMHAVGTVLLVHGFSEHTGNYASLIQDLVANQFAVMALDLRGHGLSEGPAGHVDSPSVYAEDLESFTRLLFPQLLPNRPLFLWAHSLGALVGLQALHRKKLIPRPQATVLTSPLLGFPELTGGRKIMAKLAPLVARVLPSLPITHGIGSSILSRDEEYLARRLEDPLIKNVATPKWLEATKVTVREVQEDAESFQTNSPTLLLLAGDEQVTNLNEARRFAFRAYAGMKHKVIEFPGMLHELEKEPAVRSRIVAESIAWFRSHI